MLNRRRWLLAAGGVWVPPLVAQVPDFWREPRQVWLRRERTGEELNITYWRDGRLQPQAYADICHLLRDVGFEHAIVGKDPRVVLAVQQGRLPARVQTHAAISPRVLDALYAVGGWLRYFGQEQAVSILSAYRHPFYNHVMVEGAARDSLHTQARAVDLRIEGVPVARMAEFGRWLGVGGVGFYPSKGFIHMDDGAHRHWSR